ncbi:T9SS type A sorting domain-containing protein [Owenweeksia hongkongensis]|uniref:T9SS type A sorting domain-containing protein n=1 Tax=Owenweeksia hongkongensis TaxID=253245 RepID=UPI003A951935
MKKYLHVLLFSVISLTSMQASHLAGGDIWYEYIGTASNPHRYKVNLALYRDETGVPMCPSFPCFKTVCITSSCFPEMSISLSFDPITLAPNSDTLVGSRVGSIITPGQLSCLSPAGVFFFHRTELYYYSAEVDLPGICSDFNFSFSEVARNQCDNLQGALDFYIEAGLDNSLGNNSSPTFLSPAVKTFCAGKEFTWHLLASEPDGDSLYYSLDIPLAGNCGGAYSPIAYTPGYHQSQPITTAPGAFAFDYKTGTITFTGSQQEVITFKITVEEFRLNSATNSFYKIGQTSRDVQLPILASSYCTASLYHVLYSSNASIDSIPHSTCQDSSIIVKFYNPILTSTVAADGSDFGLTYSLGQLIPIKGASPVLRGKNNLECREVEVFLHQPLSYNDTLMLTVRKGSDLNTLETSCGFEINEGDSLFLKVDGCQGWVSTAETKMIGFSVYPNPANDFLKIECPNPAMAININVLDLSGKILINLSSSDVPDHLDISPLPQGFYALQLQTDEGVEVIKFEKR